MQPLHFQCPRGYFGRSCEFSSPVCESRPCENGGRCIPNPTNGRHFVCICRPGTGGQRCEEDTLNECASSPCLNGGVCVDLKGGFQCRNCPPGFCGQRCELDRGCPPKVSVKWSPQWLRCWLLGDPRFLIATRLLNWELGCSNCNYMYFSIFRLGTNVIDLLRCVVMLDDCTRRICQWKKEKMTK